MEYVSVLVAAAAAYAFGAAWYMSLSKQWLKAADVACDANGKPKNGGATPFIISAISVILVAGMMRHVFVMAHMSTLVEGLMGGFGAGLFLVTPWVVTNYAYAGRSRNLMLIDGAYATIGSTIIGVVLVLFGI